MRTERERIAMLEEQVLELRAALAVAGALPIFVVQTTLDEMVDRRLLDAEIRAAIFNNVRQGLRTVSIGSEEIARGATQALPFYRAFANIKHGDLPRPERVRKETLRVRTQKPDSDQ